MRRINRLLLVIRIPRLPKMSSKFVHNVYFQLFCPQTDKGKTCVTAAVYLILCDVAFRNQDCSQTAWDAAVQPNWYIYLARPSTQLLSLPSTPACIECLHCTLSLTAQYIVIGPVCNGRAFWICGSFTTTTWNYVHLSSPNSARR